MSMRLTFSTAETLYVFPQVSVLDSRLSEKLQQGADHPLIISITTMLAEQTVSETYVNSLTNMVAVQLSPDVNEQVAASNLLFNIIISCASSANRPSSRIIF